MTEYNSITSFPDGELIIIDMTQKKLEELLLQTFLAGTKANPDNDSMYEFYQYYYSED